MTQTKKSQNERILEFLKSGGKLTTLNALMFFDCLRLGARVYELKEQGHDIKSEMILTDTGKHVSRYWMEV